MAREVVLDFETASAADLEVVGAYRYAQDPSTEILSLTYGEMPLTVPILWVPELGFLHQPLRQFVEDPETTFVAHNCGFEKSIWREIMVKQFGWPDIPNTRWADTMAVCAMRVIPLNLEGAARALRLSIQKDTEGSKITVGLSKPNKRGYYERSPEVLRRVYTYNATDIFSQASLHARLGPLPKGERQVWLLDQRINERGCRLDLPYISKAQQVVARGMHKPLSDFATLTATERNPAGLKPSQIQKFGAWVKDRGVYVPNLAKDTLAELLGATEDGESVGSDEWFTTQDIPDDVRSALEIKQLIGSAAIKKLPRMDQCVCFDGRARGILQYHGAGPGLWAGRLFQPQNFPRGTLKIKDANGEDIAPPPQLVVDAIMTGDAEYVAATIGPPIETVVSGLRHAIIAGPGRVLLAGDYSGIQARTVLALAGQHDKTALMASGADVYLDMAKSIYKRPDLTKKSNPEERQIGKNSVLGLGFQMGARKFRFRYAAKQPIEFAENVVYVYRKEWAPQVPKLWYALEDAAVRAVWDHKVTSAYGIEYRLEDAWLTARLPSGRKIWYFNPRPVRQPAPWNADEVKQAWTYQGRKNGQLVTVSAFGGLLTENVVMGIQRDLMVTAGFKLEQNGFPIILNVHDEWITEPLVADADPEAFEQIMNDIPDWALALQIPVATEVWSTPQERYKK